jgi:hypothetical protein
VSFPVYDWQFWAVTGVFVAAMVWVFRGALPGSAKRRKKRGHRATLTLGGRAVGKE